ncbi:MAG: 2-amino-4-hydroxy-6-hydroxymethyldihydropteridine diphosphokinase [Clostridiales bacterium]|nr:2-amino-4-hydroxy-6-hydroxymethyldihydropteridine diphosphokinase [Clostridiales bacterium]
MNKILIRGLTVSACHGVRDFEKVNPQPFVFDADIYYDFSKAYLSDDLNDTINYSQACNKIAAVTTNNSFDLIEKLAYECAYAVMEGGNASKIELTVYKPEAPVKQKFDTVGVSIEVERTVSYLSLGSSMGDKKSYLDTAIQKLCDYPHISVKKVSDYIETQPYGGVAKNTFLNCAVEIETLYSARQLLDIIHKIEAECDRVRSVHWEDRTLDIDIIFFGKQVILEDDLIVPHADYHRRDFVLTPLRQIAPNFICPVLKKAIKDI